jgi:lysozyme
LEGLRELPEGFHSHGVDISHYQGEIDWDTFSEETDSIISFVYCKATEGVSFVDKRWESNEEALREHEIPFGAYHFFIPGANAQVQADHYLNNYTPQQNDLPPVLDVETEGVTDEALIRNMREWLSIVEQATGKRPVIYTSFNFYYEKFRNKFAGYKFWIANYNDRPDRMTDDAIIHWQYSDRGTVPGINGAVDLNVSKIDFE